MLELNQPPNNFWGKVILLAVIAACLLALCSCGCDYHLRKLEQKCGKMTVDTLTYHDTLITQEVKHDTVFKYFQKDTVVIREGKLTMKYFYRDHDSTVYFQGKCAPDTIIRELRIPYEKTNIEVKQGLPLWLFWLILGIGATFAGLYFLRK